MSEEAETEIAVQTYPFPYELEELVKDCVYRPGWDIRLEDRDRGQGSRGLTLIVTTLGYDSYNVLNGQTYAVNHFFPVPPAAYDRRSWQWWLFAHCLKDVDDHERAEFFQIDGERPYAPLHGPGNDPYMTTEERTDIERRTSFTGEVKAD